MRGEDRVRPVQSSSIPSIDDHIPTFPSPSWLQQPLTSSSKQSQSDSFTFGRLAVARVRGSQVTYVYKWKSEVGAVLTHITGLARFQAPNICICSNVGLHILQVVAFIGDWH